MSNTYRSSWLTPHHIALSCLIGLCLTLLLAFQPESYIRDSLTWAVITEKSPWPKLFHVHHLLYMPVNRILYDACQLLGTCTVVKVGQIQSIVWLLVMTTCLHFLIRRLTTSLALAILLPILTLVSRNVWVFGMQPQVYAPVLGIWMVLTWKLLELNQSEPTGRWLFQVCGLFIFAVCYHQSVALFSIPLAYYVIAKRKKAGIALTTVILGVSGGIVLLLYLFAFALNTDSFSVQGFTKWLLGFGAMPDPQYFGLYNFSLNGLLTFSTYQFERIVTLPWSMKSLLGILFGLMMVAVLCWNLVMAMKNSEHKEERLFFIIWLLTFLLLILWGNPIDDAWYMLTLLPLIMLFSLSLDDWFRLCKTSGNRLASRALFIALIAFTATVAARNLYTVIWPMHRDRDPAYFVASKINDAVPRECRIFTHKQELWENLNYYFGRNTMDWWDLFTFFYHSKDLTQEKPLGWNQVNLADLPCFAIPSKLIDPIVQTGTEDGFTNPKRWLAYLKWTFGAAETDNLTFYRYEVAMRNDVDEQIVIFPKQKMKADSLIPFIEELSKNLRPQSKPTSIQTWLDKNASLAQ